MDLGIGSPLGYWPTRLPDAAQYVLAQSVKAHNQTVSVLTAAHDGIECVHLNPHLVDRVIEVLILNFRSFAESTPLYPVGAAALSVLVLSGQLVWRLRARTREHYMKLAQSDDLTTVTPTDGPNETEDASATTKHVGQDVERAIFAFNLVRAATTVALLGMSIFSVVAALGRTKTLTEKEFELVFYVGTCVAYVSPLKSLSLRASQH